MWYTYGTKYDSGIENALSDQGKPAPVSFNGAVYIYIKNLLGDIVVLLDASKSFVVEYKYDAWGAPTCIYSASTACNDLAFDNPFRYRGYVWDEETRLYYLGSRYYMPKYGRFIQPDSLLSDGLGNLYCYTNNNVISCIDIDGYKTYAIGYQTSAVLGPASMSIAEGICWDDQGNIGRFITYGGLEGDIIIDEKFLEGNSTLTVGIGYLSAVDFYQETNLPSINDLNGISSSMGISFSLGVSLGVDLLYKKPINSLENEFIGVQTSAGAGIGLDFGHLTNCFTIVYPLDNTYSGVGNAVHESRLLSPPAPGSAPKKRKNSHKSFGFAAERICK